MVGHVLARHFAANLRMQVAHGVDGAEIEIFAKDEGAGDPCQRLDPFAHGATGQVGAAVHHAGLDPGIAFPFPALGDEIIFQRVHRTDQRPRVAIRAQAHVDSEHLAIGRQFAERGNDALAQAGEEVVVFDRFRAGGIAFFRVDKDVVDVGRDIQLASAELAHADDHQALRAALAVQWFAIGGDQLAMIVVEREIGRDVGKQGHALDNFRQRRQVAEVAQDQVGHRPLAQAPQCTANRVVVAELALQRGTEQGHIEWLLPGRLQLGDQIRPGLQQIGEVVAVDQGGLPAGVERSIHDRRSASGRTGKI